MDDNPTFEVLSPAIVAGLLAAQGAALAAEVRSYSPALCTWPPGTGAWCANEVLGHLIEADRRGFNGRIRRLLDEDSPRLPDWDQEDVARIRRDRDRDGLELLTEFEAVRAESVALVRGLAPEQLDRSGMHALVGEISVRDLLHEWVHHDRNHVKQLFGIVQAAAWPHMGNCRRFSELE